MWKRHVLSGLLIAYGAGSWLAYQGSGRGDIADAGARSGMRVWQESNCVSCHQLYGLGGYMGPDLTNAHGEKGPDRIRTFVRYGTGRMPAHDLDERELDDLVAFLAWVDRSGRSRVPAEAVHWTGTYILEPR